ncbi:MAG TPA: DNA polymerase III subunit gamma/tau [Chthonomonadaceae bacterium]|nr:DNA polymerase III subunit gamma/tau [Chthonomonadaceae bacterium]
MTYVALYRKYRSQSFDELMGQEHVTQTLQNALRFGRVAHAYLFHGARGCGKTSTARLLARALNCVAQDGPTPTPCGTCRLCVSIRDGACMDVVEMDAASETGIDDVREKIIENVQYAPGEARYKVYIIDEVHDLSAKAFDALLKTLEEPPPHVIFILATTELHKVPITIRSRCQLFAFKRGTLQDLTAAVQRVVEAEGCTAEPEAVQAIARSAEGSWRDALSLLEQVLAYSDGHVTAETVHRAIGTVGTETLARVTETLAHGSWDETLALAGELIGSGKDVRQLLTALSGHLRDLMLVSAGAEQAAVQELGADRLAFLKPQAALYTPRTLLDMLGVLAAAEREIRFTNQHRWLLERTLLSLIPGNHAEARGSAVAVGKGSAPERAERPATRDVPSPPPLAATPTVVPKPTLAAASVVASVSMDEEEPDAVEEAAPVTPTPVKTAARSGAKPAEEVAPAARDDSRFADDVTLDVIQRAWPRILKVFKSVSPQGLPYLSKAEVIALEGKLILLAFTDSFSRDRIQNKEKGRNAIEKTINDVLKTEGYKIRCIMAEDTGIKRAEADSTPAAAQIAPLLDAPVAAAPARIADFEMPIDAPPVSRAEATNGKKMPADSPAPDAPPSDGLLAATLELFGGEVVKTEQIS